MMVTKLEEIKIPIFPTLDANIESWIFLQLVYDIIVIAILGHRFMMKVINQKVYFGLIYFKVKFSSSCLTHAFKYR